MAVTAHAPGSVTVIFDPQEGDRSHGISFATADGATVAVEPADEPVLILDGGRAEVEAVSRVLRRLNVTAAVHIATELPIGCGFGVSGAATLGAALAANAEWTLGHDRDALVEAAHKAEVAAGTGLGDVFVQDRGGLVWDRGNGLHRVPRTDRIEYTTFGGIATADVLRDNRKMERVASAGRAALEAADPEGPLSSLFRTAWAFAERTGLAPEPVTDAVQSIQLAGGAGTMAMIGATVVGTQIDGILEHETKITATGATLR